MKENSAHYEFSLTNQFFADIDAPEIQKGKLQVQLDVKKTMGIYVFNSILYVASFPKSQYYINRATKIQIIIHFI